MARYRYHEDNSDEVSNEEISGAVTVWPQQQQEHGPRDPQSRAFAAVHPSLSSGVPTHHEQEGSVQHYYYFINNNGDDQSNNLPSYTPWNTMYWRFWMFALIVMLFAIWLGCPPAPPGEKAENEMEEYSEDTAATIANTWSSYFTQHGAQFVSSAQALVFSTLWHCCKWWYVQIHDAVKAALVAHSRKATECPFRQFFESNHLEKLFRQHLVGQDTAIKVISKTLQEWNYTSQPRLRLLFAGFPNTGKHTMANMLLSDQSILTPESCWRNNSSNTNHIPGGSNRVLTLHGKDWVIPAWRREEQFVVDSYKNSLARVIQEFQREHPSGAVVILEGMEKMEPTLLNHVLVRQQLSHSGIGSSTIPTSPLLMIAMTSKFGLGAISKAIRHQSYADFVANIHLELDHANYDTDWDAIVPFQPLTNTHIQWILEQNINKRYNNSSSRKRLIVRDEGLHALAHSAYYLDWTVDDGRILAPEMCITAWNVSIVSFAHLLRETVQEQFPSKLFSVLPNNHEL